MGKSEEKGSQVWNVLCNATEPLSARYIASEIGVSCSCVRGWLNAFLKADKVVYQKVGIKASNRDGYYYESHWQIKKGDVCLEARK